VDPTPTTRDQETHVDTLLCCYDDDLDLMTLIYELDLDIPKMYTGVPKLNFLSQCFQTLEHYKQIDRQTATQTGTDATESTTTRHSRVTMTKV